MIKRITIFALLCFGCFASFAQPRNLPVPEDPYFKMEQVSCQSNGNTLYGEMYTPVYGLSRKPTIIMAHGFNSTHNVFYDLINLLTKEGFITYAFDFAGGATNSKSEGSTLDMTIFTERDNLIDVIDQVSKMRGVDPNNIFLLGESQGGLVSAMAAAKVPDKIKALGLMYPAMGIPASADRIYPDRIVPDTIKSMGITLGGNFYRSMFDYDVWSDIKPYEGPVLVTHGTADRLVNMSLGQQAADGYKNAEFHAIDGGDHGYNNPEHRAINNQYVVDFFNKQLLTIEDQLPCLASDAHQLSFVPEEFTKEAKQQGRIETLTYGDKNVKVYLPYGYDQKDKKTKYNVMYFFHGSGQTQDDCWILNPDLKCLLDNMIEKGLVEPLIFVTPTYYAAGVTTGGNEVIRDFKDEFVHQIIPLVETTYNTYTKNGKDKSIKASRAHRAMSGFSFGSACTWWTFIQSLDYFKWYMPMSGDCWALRESRGDGEAVAKYLAESVRSYPDEVKNDFFVYALTGDKDLAYSSMLQQINALQKYPEFRFDDDFSKGNIYFSVKHTGYHVLDYACHYIYNALPYFFK